MLQSIRDRAQNWIFLVIIFLLVIAFAFFGFERFFTGSQTSKIAAEVNGYKITQNAFDATYQRMKRQLQLQLGKEFVVTPKIEANLKKQALDQLIHNYVLTEAALGQGYRITQGQLNSVLTSLPLFQVNGQFSSSRFQAVLNNLFYSESSFLAQLRSDMLINQMQSGIENSTFVLPSEVATAYALINQLRTFSYVVIPASRYENTVSVSKSEKQAYYAVNQKQFANPEQVSISYIELSLANLMKKQKFTGAELKKYYENNLDSYTLPARWHAAQILVRLLPNATPEQEQAAKAKVAKIEKRLKEKKSFAETAKEYSDDVFTAKKGGVLPWFSQGMVESEIYDTASQLKVGQVSKPVRTKFGISILKLIGHTPKKLEKFADVKDRIQQGLAQQNAEKLFASETDELSNLTFSDSASLESAAKALNLKIKTTKPFTRKGLKDGVANNPKVINAAFSNAVLVQKYNSDPIQLSGSDVLVLRVDNHTAASIKPFVQVEAEITDVLKHKATAAAAEQLGQSIISTAKNEADFKALAEKNHLIMKTKANATRHEAKIQGNILNNAFQQQNPGKSGLSIDGLALSNGNYAVVAVTNVTEGNLKKMSSEQAKVFREQLTKVQGALDYNLYAKSQIDAAKIKYK